MSTRCAALLLVWLLPSACLGAPAPAAAPAPAPIDIGWRVQMFVDEHLIERKRNIEHHLTEPIRREVVLELNQPWEGPVSAYFAVFRDGDKVRMYYRGGEDSICYAESADGVSFTRPRLGLVEFEGSKANNIILRDPKHTSFAAFHDDNPDAKPDEKYKALSYTVIDRKGYMSAWASGDGVRWRAMSEKPVVPAGEYDSLNCVSWDGIEKQYRVFDRYWTGGGFRGVRAIETRTSEDFLRWSEPSSFQYAGDVPLEHFYTGAVTRCPGAEHIWLAFPMRLIPERKKVSAHTHPAVSDAVFMSSRDGITWDRPFLQALVRPGPDPRNWTDRNNMPAWGIVETPGDPMTFSMYISEHYRWPTNRLRRLTVRKHGFASMRAGAAAGELLTRPVVFSGETLTLNYATSAAGSIRVEVQDEAGTMRAESETMYGDALDEPVKWKGAGLAGLAGKPVRLRFIMSDADLFSLRFAA